MIDLVDHFLNFLLKFCWITIKDKGKLSLEDGIFGWLVQVCNFIRLKEFLRWNFYDVRMYIGKFGREFLAK